MTQELTSIFVRAMSWSIAEEMDAHENCMREDIGSDVFAGRLVVFSLPAETDALSFRSLVLVQCVRKQEMFSLRGVQHILFFLCCCADH